MADSHTIALRGDTQRAYAKRLIDQADTGYVVVVRPETRRDRQNRKMHAMIKDLRAHVPDLERFSAEDVKFRFLHELGAEMRFLPELDGNGMFPVGMRSSTLTVEQFNGLIELLYEYGARHGVVWSEPSLRSEAA
jgi:hypothetical protein